MRDSRRPAERSGAHSRRRALLRGLLAALPVIALMIVPPFIPATQPRLFGAPPIMWWIVGALLLTTPCLLAIDRLRDRA